MIQRKHAGAWTAAVPVLLACSGGGPGPELRLTDLRVEPPDALLVGLGGGVRFQAVGRGADGRQATGDAEWSVADEAVAVVDGRGFVTGAGAGTTTVSARVGSQEASARLEVYVPEIVRRFEPGRSYFGRRQYTEYVPGRLPLILSAGHGGALSPEEVADRTYGVAVNDRNTVELARAVRDALFELSGFAPHLILSHLARGKMDPNREIEEGAQGDPYAEQAWREYHEWIETASDAVSSGYGAEGSGEGLYLDVHGHSHAIARIELGYLLTAEQLALPDASLNSLPVIRASSIRELGRDSPLPFSQLLRGAESFGGFLQAEGVASVPSPADPSPGTAPYFRGGYSTRRHGSMEDGAVISGIQLEHPYPGMRDTPENRQAYAEKAARAIRGFMLRHMGYFEPAGAGPAKRHRFSTGAGVPVIRLESAGARDPSR